MDDMRDQARQRLNAALGRIAASVVDNDASTEVLTLTADAAEEFAAKLTTQPPGRVLWGYVTTRAADVRGALVLGLTGPGVAAPPMAAVGNGMRGVVRFDAGHEGPAGQVHGGHIAWLVDEACAAALGSAVVLRTVQVIGRYLAPVPLHELVEVVAEVTSQGSASISVHAEVRSGALLCAEAEAVFVRMQPQPGPGQVDSSSL
jgi:acyl-coenzyme A thioesterase PaaI-like protein